MAIVKAILIPRIVRALMGDDDDDAWGLLPIGIFLFLCVGLVYAEYAVITACFFGMH